MEYIKIGKIVKTHGIKGELRILSKFDRKDLVFKPEVNLYIGEEKIKEKIINYRKHKEFDMVVLAGYDNINQVLKYIKQNVYVLREDLSLTANEYLIEDLIGLDVIENDTIIGQIDDIVDSGKNNILLQVKSSKNFYIPKNENFIQKVDLTNKKIYVKNIKGLIL